MNTIDMIYDTVQKVQSTQDQMATMLVSMQKDLEYHIKRTDILEDYVRKLDQRTSPKSFSWKNFGIKVAIVGTGVGTFLKVLELLTS